MTTPGKPVSMIRAVWQGEHRFDTGRVGQPTARIDGSAATGQSPTDALLSALAACSAIDVVDILEKRRTPSSGPKSMVNLMAGLRASGKGSACSTVPTRMSSAAKSSGVAMPVK